MIRLNDINLMNETMIIYLKKIGMNAQRNEMIKRILEDEACFFKMEKEDAYTILKDVGVKENTDAIYAELVSNDVFYDLYKRGKIQENDKELVVKYKIYNEDNLFKNNKPKQRIEESAITVKEETFFSKIVDKLRNFFKKNSI